MFQALADTFLTAPGVPPPANSSSKPPSTRTSPRKSAKQEREESQSQNGEYMQHLKNELLEKDAAIKALTARLQKAEGSEGETKMAGDGIVQRKHNLSSMQHIISDKGRNEARMGTRGSLLTSNVMESLSEDVAPTDAQEIAKKFISVFQNPTEHFEYLQSPDFASDLVSVSEEVATLFEEEPRCLFMQSPVYVFGDIHGNLEDLHFFADNIWKLGMDLTAGQFLFLGDYVDRGLNCLECVAYMFGLKLLFPGKIFMLRGNHETRDVNGWEEHYGDRSFLYQCKDRFGEELGELVWEECNQAFDRLPLSGVIDHEIFCIHGGIPRLVPAPISARAAQKQPPQTEIQSILAVPNTIGIMPAYKHESNATKQIAADCIWSDPASEQQELYLNKDGFGESPRGGGAVCFGSKAIDNFLARNNLSYIIRAHEAHAQGVSLSKGARVFTVFSTSKDHRQGSQAMAGCILVDVDNIQVINRSPKYKNKYVHRRTSISLENLSDSEMEKRKKLGLIRFSIADADYYRQKQLDLAAEDDAEMDDEETETATHRPSFGSK